MNISKVDIGKRHFNHRIFVLTAIISLLLMGMAGYASAEVIYLNSTVLNEANPIYEITDPGTYVLDGDIYLDSNNIDWGTGPKCAILVRASEVTIDGQDHIIEGMDPGDGTTNWNTPAILVGSNPDDYISYPYPISGARLTNITIRNVRAKYWATGIFLANVSGGQIENNHISSVLEGIGLTDILNTNISGNSVDEIQGDWSEGTIHYSASSSEYKNNSFENNQLSLNDDVEQNVLLDNPVSCYFSGNLLNGGGTAIVVTNAEATAIKNNTISNFNTNAMRFQGGINNEICNNSIQFGQSGNGLDLGTSSFTTICDNSIDVEYGSLVIGGNNNTILRNLITCLDEGVKLDGNNNYVSNNSVSSPGQAVILNGFSNTVANNSLNGVIEIMMGSVIAIRGNNNIIINNEISEDDVGIEISQGENNIIANNSITSNKIGISINDAQNNQIFTNSIRDNEYGISVSATINDCQNEIFDNYLNNGGQNVLLVSNSPSNSPHIVWNTSKKDGPNIIGGPSIGGNHWGDPGVFSFSAIDSDGDGFSDEPYHIDENNIDYLPLYGQPPIGRFSYKYIPSNEDDRVTIQFFDNTTYPSDPDPYREYTYAWDFGDGGNNWNDAWSGDQNPVHTYVRQPDNFPLGVTVSLNVFDLTTGATIATTERTVSVSGNPVVRPAFYFETGNLTEPTTFRDISSSDFDIKTVSWDFGDGVSNVTEAGINYLYYDYAMINPVHQYSALGTYNVTLTLTTWEGYTKTAYHYVNILQNVPSSFIISEGELNLGGLDIDHNRVVWASVPEVGTMVPQIFMYNINSGEKTQITINSNAKWTPSFSGDRIVWLEVRDGKNTIIVYNLLTKQEEIIPAGEGDPFYPLVSGENVIYGESSPESMSLMVYNLTTQEKKLIAPSISPSGTDAYDFDGNYVTYVEFIYTDPDQNAGYSVLYVYDLLTDQRIVITQNSWGFNPSISGTRVVWEDNRNYDGYPDIYMYDIASGIETPICIETGAQRSPRISGNHIVWSDDTSRPGDIYLFDISNSTTIPMTASPGGVNAPSSPGLPRISENTVIWNVWEYSLSSIRGTKIGPDQNLPPVADFTYAPYWIETDDAVQFTDQSVDSDGTITTWAWNFGDDAGSTSNQRNTSFQYLLPGPYNVTLTVTDSDGETNTTLQSIYVDLEPQFTISPEHPTNADLITFTDISTVEDSFITRRVWDFDDGTSKETTAPGIKSATHKFTWPGYYYIRLTLIDTNGEQYSEFLDIYVRDANSPGNMPPKANFTFAPVQPHPGMEVTFEDTSTDENNEIEEIFWNFGDGTEQSDEWYQVDHVYTAVGTYTVSLTVTDESGASDTIQKQIHVVEESTNLPPQAAFTIFPPVPRTGDLVYFDDASTDIDGSIVEWHIEFGDGETDDSTHPYLSHTYQSPGTYSVNLTVTDDDGATSTASETISIVSFHDNQLPVAAFSLSPAEPTTADIVTFTDESMDSDGTITGWEWYFDDYWSGDSESTLQNPTHRFVESGWYEVDLDVYDDHGDYTGTYGASREFFVRWPDSMSYNLTIPGGSLEDNHITLDTGIAGVNVTYTSDTISWKQNGLYTNITTSGITETNGVLDADITGITISSEPVTEVITGVGHVEASFGADLSNLPADSFMVISIDSEARADAYSAFQLAATNAGMEIQDVAFTINILKEEIWDGEDLTNAVIRMVVNSSWVQAQGGAENIHIFRYPEWGPTQILETQMTDLGEGRILFEAFSPDGMSTFGLVGTRPVQTGTTVILKDSMGNGIAGANVSYYQGGWKEFGTTGADGTVAMQLPNELTQVSFRVSYGGASFDKKQDIRTNPTVLFQTTRVTASLKDSANAPIGDGEVTYYAGGWKEFGTLNTAGTASRELLPGNYSFRMSYAGASTDTKQNVTANPSVTFETTHVIVELRDGSGALITAPNAGLAKYYAGGWRDFGTTSGGTCSKELLPVNYTFRMTYQGKSNDKAQNVSENPLVSFKATAPVVTVRLTDSNGNPLPGGNVSYYAGGWKEFGTTGTDGNAVKELLPGNYSFRMSYASGSKDLQQDVGSEPTVAFSTINTTVELRSSSGSLITDPNAGSVQYYAGGWKPFGSTNGGIVSKELLANNYTFRMTYQGTSSDKAQDTGVNPTVTFQTGGNIATVQLIDSTGNGISGGSVQYYAGGWKEFGTTGADGNAVKELLPGNYSFRMTYANGSIDKKQDTSTGPVVFQTRNVAVKLINSTGQPIDTGSVQYYAGGWRAFGTTTSGIASKELLPAQFSFRMTYASASKDKQQDISVDTSVIFQTGQVVSGSGSCTQYYAGGWRTFSNGMDLLPNTYKFRFRTGTPDKDFTITAGIVNTIQ